MPDSSIVVPDFTIPESWPRAYGLDLRWNSTAAIWGARNPESGIIYLYDEYHGEADPAVHVSAIRGWGDWLIGMVDPTANGRNQADGETLIQAFRKASLRLRPISNPIESGILAIQQRMNSGRLKVFASLAKYWRNAGSIGGTNRVAL